MFVKSVLGLASLVSVLSLFACSAAPSSEATGKSGQAATVDPQFTSCETDDDCVAVPLAGCCHNGWLVAVRACATDDYAAANACTAQNVMCPMYVVNDTRVAACDQTSNTCTMVGPAATVIVPDAGAETDDDAGTAPTN